jgi:hypothetical protein
MIFLCQLHARPSNKGLNLATTPRSSCSVGYGLLFHVQHRKLIHESQPCQQVLSAFWMLQDPCLLGFSPKFDAWSTLNTWIFLLKWGGNSSSHSFIDGFSMKWKNPRDWGTMTMGPSISKPICQAPPSLAGHIIVSAQDERPFLTRWIPRISEPVGRGRNTIRILS